MTATKIRKLYAVPDDTTSAPAAVTPLPAPSATDPLHEAAIAIAYSPDAAVASADSLERLLELAHARSGRTSTAFVHDEGFIAGAIYGYLAAHSDQAAADFIEDTLAAVHVLDAHDKQVARDVERKLKAVKA
jgi:hypothetical protein